MDQHPILDRSSASPAAEGDMLGSSASRSATASVSAGIAAANAHLPKPAEPGPRFPAEDGGRSLADMAHSDLDAALQLLVERAQYITEATGAAIALRRGQHNDMICRASTGTNAPELGALLSMEYGLSGECVRTRQPLRCDDAERDTRVNHEVCRQLGIASVVVMPIVSDEQVLGVFELFSGKARAFEERDISALQRLSEMVETAVKYAVTTATPPAIKEAAAAELQPPADEITSEVVRVESPAGVTGPDLAPAPPLAAIPPQALEKPELAQPELEKTALKKTELEATKTQAETEPAPRKPLFWSSTMQSQASVGRSDEAAESITAPPMLRNLQKCQACGFPVSQGRTFCVECEEKQWRGQRLPQPAAGHASTQTSALTIKPANSKPAIPAPAAAAAAAPQSSTSAPIEPAAIIAENRAASSLDVPDVPVNFPSPDNSAPFFGSAMQSESWFAANKYILGALLVVAIVIGAIAWLR